MSLSTAFRQYFLRASLVIITVASFMPMWAVQAECNGYDTEDPYGITCGEETNLSNRDPRELAARLINTIITFSGIILIGYILYAGFLWMTAGGDEEKIAKAKSIISACIIGLLIVLSAYSISLFVVKNLVTVTR